MGERSTDLPSEEVAVDADPRPGHGADVARNDVVVRVARSLSVPGRLSDLLRDPLVAVCEVLDASAASLFVPYVAEDREQIRVSFARSGGELETTIVGMELGVHGHVLREGEPLIVDDVRRRPEYRGTLESAFEVSPRALLAVPLKRGGRVLGVIEVLREEPRPFVDRDLEFLEAVAVELGVAVERDLLHRQLRLDLQERELLLRITREVGASLDLGEVLEHIFDAVAEVIPYDAAGIFLADVVKDRVTVSAQRGYEPGPLESIDPGAGIIGWVMKHRQGVIVPQVRDDPRYLKGRESTQSEMAVPIVSRRRVIGSIALESDDEDAFSDRDLRIAELIAAQVSSAIVNARLHASLMRQMQVDHELALARDIQRGLLPRGPMIVPGLHVDGAATASSAVGGDYYDFYGDEERIRLAVGDVAGHGLSAALLMASMRAGVRLLMDRDADPAKAAARLDHVLLLESLPSQYVAAVLCVLDLRKMTLRYCNAGHHPPLLLSEHATTSLLGGGRPLGILPGSVYETVEVDVAPGDVLAFYTDGLVEEPNRDGEEFGTERLATAVREASDSEPTRIIEHVRGTLRRFKGGRRANRDDVTLMIARLDPV